MKRAVDAVSISDGKTAFVRSLNAIEYLDLQADLDAEKTSETTQNREKVKRGIAVKIFYGICNADGVQQHQSVADALEFMQTITFKDAIKIVKAFDLTNSLADEALEATEKK